MSFQTEHDGFLKDMEVHNYSPLSIAKYQRCVRMFLDWLKAKGIASITKVDGQVLKDYYDVLSQNPKFSVHYVVANVNVLKRFFGYLVKNGDILYDFSTVLKAPNTKNILPLQPLTQEEVTKMLGAPDLRTPLGIRDKALLETFYSCGIRVSEAASLEIRDLDLARGFLFIRDGKGRKDRVVPLGQHAIFFINTYLERVRPLLAEKQTKKGGPVSDRLWLNRRGLPVVKQDIIFMVRYLRKKVGIEKQVSPHSFRRTVGVQMIRNGADFLAVKELLGHSQNQSTIRYLTLSGVDLTEALKKCHPRYEEKTEDAEDVSPKIVNFKEAADGRIRRA